MRVLILCGGQGTRLREETEFRPKPLIDVGGRPILWHIMKHYARYGFREFVLLLGYKGEMIRQYFLNYHTMNCDVTVALDRPGDLRFHGTVRETDWRVTLVDTGLRSLTGARIARAARHIDGDRFLVTYGDGVTDVDLASLVRFHQQQGKIGTVTGVHAPGRFGDLTVEGDLVKHFVEKPEGTDFINGGFFIFERAVLDYLSEDEQCLLEREPLERLARAGQLSMFRHDGFWQCIDTYRDFTLLNELWESRRAPWKTWSDEAP